MTRAGSARWSAPSSQPPIAPAPGLAGGTPLSFPIMLLGLAIRDLVLIDRLDLSFGPGLCVLTGEAGAGKSILLDALGLTLGLRAESGLVRAGAAQAIATAEFALPDRHPARDLLREAGFDATSDRLVLRRVVQADGRSRAFIDDQPASIGLLARVGDCLVE